MQAGMTELGPNMSPTKTKNSDVTVSRHELDHNQRLDGLEDYANLNKVKQPFSPGARLTNFINSLFANANSKKTKKSSPNGGFEDSKMETKSKSQQGSSTCSSASSLSRSCLINNSSKPVEKMGIGNRRTVRFHPVSVIVDEDSNSLPYAHKSVKKLKFLINLESHHCLQTSDLVQERTTEEFKIRLEFIQKPVLIKRRMIS
ncbi:Uncharacterized protein Fot_02648 [Forsythia ovata]|uniref:Uncharacterized protein n=1 Tax=Forsythia ovata TaxID=205694 RepID=A0ABD1X7G5_9LAMI